MKVRFKSFSLIVVLYCTSMVILNRLKTKHLNLGSTKSKNGKEPDKLTNFNLNQPQLIKTLITFLFTRSTLKSTYIFI